MITLENTKATSAEMKTGGTQKTIPMIVPKNPYAINSGEKNKRNSQKFLQLQQEAIDDDV